MLILRRNLLFAASISFLSITTALLINQAWSLAQAIPDFPNFPDVETEPFDNNDSTPIFNDIDPLTLPSGLNQDSFADGQLITVSEILFEGNQIFSNDEIQDVLTPFLGKTLPANKLFEIETAINELYKKAGYQSNGAIIVDDAGALSFDQSNAIIKLQIVERVVKEIEVSGSKGYSAYVKRYFHKFKDKPLNEERILNGLRFLIDKESIDSVNVVLRPTEFINEIDIQLDIKTGRTTELLVFLNNERSPSTGDFERGLSLIHRNPTAQGDELQLNYRNTDGSNLASISYEIPVNSEDGSISFNYLFANSRVTEAPLNELNLASEINQIGLSFRQPILQKSDDSRIQELAIGIGVKRYDSRESLDDFPFPLSSGSNENGKNRSTVVNLFQEFSHRTLRENLNVHSDFAFGTPLGSTNDAVLGDGSFFKFNLQGQYLRRLTNRIAYLTSINGQLSSRSLSNNEQFSIGGKSSVRGFNPSIIDGDLGVDLAQEIRFTIFNPDDHNLEIAPFFDYGFASNVSNRVFEEDESLGALGLSLRYQFKDRLLAILDYAQPIIGRKQFKGADFTFSVLWRLF